MQSKLAASLFLATAATLISQTVKFDLPAPYATKSAANAPKVIPRPDKTNPRLPAGFQIEEYAGGFVTPRIMILGPSGEILLSDTTQNGAVYALTNGGKDRKKVIDNISNPFGLAIWKDYLYVAQPTSVKRYKYDAKAMTAGPGEEIIALPEMGEGHSTRQIRFDPKGEKLYLTIGSQSNVDAGEPRERASIRRYNPDGTGGEYVAEGLRNPTSIHFYPGTNTLWASVQERDGLGDDLVPDYLTSIKEGAFYGWPYAYIGQNQDPRRKGENKAAVAKANEMVEKTIAPDLLLGAHRAVLDFHFYQGTQFPQKYRGGVFLAFHGSWNRSARLGYSVAFVPMKDGRISGPIEDFLTGFMLAPDQKEVWGRPVGILGLPDGSLLVSDDGGKKIWRISYKP